MTTLRELRLTDRLSAFFGSRKAAAAGEEAEVGMSTVEYAIGLVGAGCAAGILVKFLQSNEFGNLIKKIILGLISKMVPGFA